MPQADAARGEGPEMMRGSTSTRIAWLLWSINVMLVVFSTVLVILNRSTPTDAEPMPLLLGAGYSLVFLLSAGIGALIIAFQPMNRAGWSLYALGTMATVVGAANEYGIYGMATNPDAVPIPRVAAWCYSTGNALMVPLIALILLLFPNGRLLSSRWRLLVWLLGTSAVLAVLWNLNPGQINDFPIETDNPFGILPSAQVSTIAGIVSLPFAFIGIIGGLVTLTLRFRRARGKERQQMKWLAVSASVMVMVGLSAPILWAAAPSLWSVVFLLGIVAIPTGVGIAILRYDLYDVDVIINRTLVYGTVTLSLALSYLVLVITLETFARSLVGTSSSLVVAASTLAVAALFRPLRNQIQARVDRRFYRHKYDAARILEAFSARLRDEIELTALTTELRRVAQEAMQPASVSIWLRGDLGTISLRSSPIIGESDRPSTLARPRP